MATGVSVTPWGLDEDRDEVAGTSRDWRPRLLAAAPSGLKTDSQAASEMW